MIDKTFSEIIKRFTSKQFKIVACLIVIGFIVFSKGQYPELTRKVLSKTYHFLKFNWHFTLGLLVPIIAILILLRKSTKEFNKNWKRNHPNIEKWSANEKRILHTKIVDNHREQTREILILNTQGDDLYDLEGKVRFYRHDSQIESIPFKTKCLEKGKEERIILDNFNTKKKRFSEFHTYIEKCRNLELSNDFKILGQKLPKTHSSISNRHHFFLWWEYSWIKDKNRQLFSWIKLMYSTPAKYEHYEYRQYYKERPWLYLRKLQGEPWNYFWKRQLNQLKIIAVCSILIGVILISSISFYQIGKGIMEIMKSI